MRLYDGYFGFKIYNLSCETQFHCSPECHIKRVKGRPPLFREKLSKRRIIFNVNQLLRIWTFFYKTALYILIFPFHLFVGKLCLFVYLFFLFYCYNLLAIIYTSFQALMFWIILETLSLPVVQLLAKRKETTLNTF